jgi:hypothetical protein
VVAGEDLKIGVVEGKRTWRNRPMVGGRILEDWFVYGGGNAVAVICSWYEWWC